MNNSDKNRNWILYTIVAISLGISFWALVIANSDGKLVFDSDKTFEFVGLLFTVIATVFSFYFVIIGINAHRIKQEIELNDEKLKEEQDAIIENLKNEQKTIIENFGKVELEQQDTMYSHLMLQAKTIDNSSTRETVFNSILLSRARLATKSKLLPLELRKRRIPDLIDLGEQSDIEDLMRIVLDDQEDGEIKKIAIGIIPIIEKKLVANKQNQQDKTAGVTNH